MNLERNVKLFRNGSDQALRIPKEFEFDCDEAILHKDGDKLIIAPVRKGKLLDALASSEPLTVAFPEADEKIIPLDNVNL